MLVTRNQELAVLASMLFALGGMFAAAAAVYKRRNSR